MSVAFSCLIVPPNVALNSVDLAVKLEQLSFQVSFTEVQTS